MQFTLIHYFALAGLLLSLYFLYVKRALAQSKNYKPLCDISDILSCSKAAQSRQSNVAILPNAFYGVIFYLIVFLFASTQPTLVFSLALLASIVSIYLITTSIKLKIICPVCTLIYLINFAILYLTFK